MALDIQKYYLKNNRCYKQAVTRKPIGIQIHSIGTAQGTAKAVADYWNQSSVSCAVTYIVDSDISGKVLQTLPEEYYTWADAGYGNRNLITIEICESDFMKYSGGGASYEITNHKAFEDDILRGYDTAVALCADICKRYNWDPEAKLPSGLFLISSHNEGRLAGLSSAHVDPSHIWPQFDLSMTTFRKAVKNAIKSGSSLDNESVNYYRVRTSWETASTQLGAYENKQNAIDACPPGYSVFDYKGRNVYTNKSSITGTQASDFKGLTETQAAEKILELVHSCDKSGILNSVSAAQMILESGYVTTNLSKIANNCFGMKVSLSGNSWDSVWDGSSSVKVLTWEVYNGKSTKVYDYFRKYPCIEDSIKDHAAYLLGAMNGNKKRYEGLLNAKDYKKAITIIKNGGYATDPDYISKICAIIQRFGLDKYDKTASQSEKSDTQANNTTYRVQVGAYKVKKNAEKKRDSVKKASGYSCVVTSSGGLYLVICGSFKIKTNAESRIAALKKLKIEAFINEI